MGSLSTRTDRHSSRRCRNNSGSSSSQPKVRLMFWSSTTSSIRPRTEFSTRLREIVRPWKLSFQGKTLEGTRFMAYRQMFLNHIVHHRAQLGVYLRLNGTPLPGTYGPSADDTMGF